MTIRRTLRASGMILREFILAAGVLALVFLSFGHQPVNASAAAAEFRLADGSVAVFCGDGPGDTGHVQGPCHACRVQIADLPPPPCEAEPAYTGFTIAFRPAAAPVPVRRAPHALKTPRAPPVRI